jgi:hypothetical protein
MEGFACKSLLIVSVVTNAHCSLPDTLSAFILFEANLMNPIHSRRLLGRIFQNGISHFGCFTGLEATN